LGRFRRRPWHDKIGLSCGREEPLPGKNIRE
jgi:hypothetical protein